jgi:DNA-binding MarR family transcriptional regulator
LPGREPDRVDEIAAQWHRERSDLDVSSLALLGRLFRVAHLADLELARGTAAHGLRPGWFDLLAALRRAGPPYQLTPSELMRATMLSSGGMTKRLDRLTEARLVTRRPDPGDRRGTLVRLTPKGLARFDRALETHLDHEARLLEPLTATERRQFDRVLRRLLAELERREPQSGR